MSLLRLYSGYGCCVSITQSVIIIILLYIIKLIEPSAMKLINIQKDSSDVLAGQIFRLT